MNPEPDQQSADDAQDLARKLNLLMDVASTEGHTPTYRELAELLAAKGINLSRARWSYMTAGTGAVVKDRKLLDAISAYFDVDPAFLAGELGDDLPDRIEAQLDLVRAMRAARVKSFAARALRDVSPETLKAITRFLDDEIAGGSR